MTTKQYFGGIEGGASHTTLVIIDSCGNQVASAEGPDSNHWLIGLDKCLERLSALVEAGKQKAGLDTKSPLKGLGMCLSGGDSADARTKIENGFKEKYPNTSEHYFVTCDTIGAVATACEAGGMVLISGTGSNCELVNPDGQNYRCGGWGHIIGDEGSAYWISHYCMKNVFDSEDNFEPTSHDITLARDIMYKHFNVDSRMAMLDHFYSNFNKTKMAAQTKELANAARDKKDALCVEAFYEAGKLLSKHIVALVPKTEQSLLNADGGLKVVCVGSVWKSWDLLQDGFKEGLKKNGQFALKEITLVQLKKDSHQGAAFLGAKAAGFKLPMNYAESAEVFANLKF